MRGFLLVQLEGLALARNLTLWVYLALEFNPKAKPSRKRC